MNVAKYNIGSFLNILSKKTKNFVVLNSLLKKELALDEFEKNNEDRFFDFGYSVSCMVSAGSGFLLRAKTPIIFANTEFLLGRAYMSLRNDFSLCNSNVKVVGFASGFDNGLKGAGHQFFEDISLLKNLYNIKVYCPSSLKSFFDLLEKSIYEFGPTYFRLSADLPEEVESGFSDYSKDISDEYLVISYGKMYGICCEAVELLREDGLKVNLLDVSQVFPFEYTKFEALFSAKKVFIVEDQNQNGLFAEISKNLVLSQKKAQISFLGIQNGFSESGKVKDLYKKHGLDYLSLYRQMSREMI